MSAFCRVRDYMHEELGLARGGLTWLHQQILRHAPALEVSVAVRPAHLPQEQIVSLLNTLIGRGGQDADYVAQ